LRVIEGEDIVFVRKIYGVWLCQPSALGVAWVLVVNKS
jgi:hypothetical protein